MRTIFVHVKCELGKSYTVAAEAADTVEEVSEVYSTSGDFDLLMKCNLADDIDVGRFVNERIHPLPGIKDTYTVIAFKAFS